MDSNLDAGPTGQVSSESTLTAYPLGATSDVAVTAPQFAFTSSPDTRTPSFHLASQSRNNLRQASLALDTAYERITSLRNSINNMLNLNRIPPEALGTGTSTSATETTVETHRSLSSDTSIGPPHSALVLSGEQVVEELNLRAARLRSLVSPSARQRLEEFESNSRNSMRGESSWDRFSQNDRSRLDRRDVRLTPTRPRTPPMPDLVIPRARDLDHPRAPQRRDLQSAHRDDPSTMIGRRVAARVNATPDGHASLSSRLSLSQIEQRLQAQTAQIARELENMTDRLAATTRSRRVELASSSSRGNNTTTAAQDGRASLGSHAASTTASGDTRLMPNLPAGARPLRPTREVTLVDNSSRIVLPQPISRTSSDGIPIDDLSAPARRSLSAAYREHIAAYRDHAPVGNRSGDSPQNLVNVPEVRETLANLLTRDQDERLLPAHPAERTWSRPGGDINRRDNESVRSSPSPPVAQGSRRRGWTWLNADGDEIDSDEDENVSPHTRRLRMRFAYGTPNEPATRSHTVTIEDILWRTSGSDSEADVLSPDSTEGYPLLFNGSPPRPPLTRPHPLPTPSEEMLIYPSVKPSQQSRDICVSKYASLAGR